LSSFFLDNNAFIALKYLKPGKVEDHLDRVNLITDDVRVSGVHRNLSESVWEKMQ